MSNDLLISVLRLPFFFCENRRQKEELKEELSITIPFLPIVITFVLILVFTDEEKYMSGTFIFFYNGSNSQYSWLLKL